MEYFLLGQTFFAIIGAIFATHKGYTLFSKWRDNRKESQIKEGLLKNTDQFFAHIVHLGGMHSTTHSLQIYSGEEEGFYFDDSEDFVTISFNRNGDIIVIKPAPLSRKFGFKISSVVPNKDALQKSTYSNVYHLTRTLPRNEAVIKFTKVEKI